MIALETLSGRLTDLDAHEWVPFDRVGEVFGERGAQVIKSSPNFSDRSAYNMGYEYTADLLDSTEITPTTVWEVKGSAAPGAYDFDRRPAVLDAMGIDRQLVFPGMALVAQIHAQGGLLKSTSEAERAIGWGGIDAHNEWAASVTSRYDRLRVVGILPVGKPGLSPTDLAAEAARLIKSGIKAIQIDSGTPPAGVSPADGGLDRFYATLAEANVPLVIHPPAGLGFIDGAWLRTDAWFIGEQSQWMGASNMIAMMVLGGVFQRHPALRFAAIELGAQWFGPLADAMDNYVERDRRPHRPVGYPFLDGKLKEKPSDFLARNVRVTPYLWERTLAMFERYPHLQDCYCFSSDYPHGEGGPWANTQFYDEIKSLGDKVIEKFFVTNGELILPT
jgi:predicted TIM-barrel fold metal-dependent hydrolase